jgi:hypothetical protein
MYQRRAEKTFIRVEGRLKISCLVKKAQSFNPLLFLAGIPVTYSSELQPL